MEQEEDSGHDDGEIMEMVELDMNATGGDNSDGEIACFSSLSYLRIPVHSSNHRHASQIAIAVLFVL
jgi:hypothetical protein